MWKYAVGPGSPQMTIRRMRTACWVPKLINTHSEYVIFIDFPLQQWLFERASMLRLYEHCLPCFIHFLQNYGQCHDGRFKRVRCIWCGSIMHNARAFQQNLNFILTIIIRSQLKEEG